MDPRLPYSPLRPSRPSRYSKLSPWIMLLRARWHDGWKSLATVPILCHHSGHAQPSAQAAPGLTGYAVAGES
jgi:hypothetical protein